MGRDQPNRLGLERVLLVGEGPAPNLGKKGAARLSNAGVEVRVLLRELWLEVRIHAQQVVADEHLAIAVQSSANADGRDRKALADLLGQLERHPFQHQRIAPRLLDRDRVGKYFARGLFVSTLDSIATHLVNGLWRKSKMPHHRDARPNYPVDDVRELFAPLQLHRLHVA